MIHKTPKPTIERSIYRSLLGTPPKKLRIRGQFQPLSPAFLRCHASSKANTSETRSLKQKEKRTTEKLTKTKNKKNVLKKNPPAPLPDVLLVDLSDPVPLPSSTASLHVEPLIDFDVYLHAPDISDPFGDPFPTLDPEQVPLPTPDSQSATRVTNSSSTEPLLN